MRFKTSAFAVALLSFGAVRGHAQTSHSHLGAHVLYNSTFDDVGLGAQLSIPVAHHLEFYPSFDYYFQTPGSVWEVNADFKYRFSGARTDWLYTGTGINFDRFSDKESDRSNNTVGWNLIAGAESLRGTIHPYAEMRVTVTDQTRFQVQAGVNITLGKHGE